MEIPIQEELKNICRTILGEGKSEEEWSDIESDDMFHQGSYSGGFDATERAFCFSFRDKSGIEHWFQFTLSEAERIASGQSVRIEGRLAE